MTMTMENPPMSFTPQNTAQHYFSDLLEEKIGYITNNARAKIICHEVENRLRSEGKVATVAWLDLEFGVAPYLGKSFTAFLIIKMIAAGNAPFILA